MNNLLSVSAPVSSFSPTLPGRLLPLLQTARRDPARELEIWGGLVGAAPARTGFRVLGADPGGAKTWLA